MADLPLRNTPAGDASEPAMPTTSESSAALLPSTSRRAMASTNETEASMDQSFVRVAIESLHLEDRLEQEAALETPGMILKRMLSIRSVVSTDCCGTPCSFGVPGAPRVFYPLLDQRVKLLGKGYFP